MCEDVPFRRGVGSQSRCSFQSTPKIAPKHLFALSECSLSMQLLALLQQSHQQNAARYPMSVRVRDCLGRGSAKSRWKPLVLETSMPQRKLAQAMRDLRWD